MDSRVIKKIKRKNPEHSDQFKVVDGKMYDDDGELIEFEDDSDDLEEERLAQYIDE